MKNFIQMKYEQLLMRLFDLVLKLINKSYVCWYPIDVFEIDILNDKIDYLDNQIDELQQLIKEKEADIAYLENQLQFFENL